ncbi:MAG TPA: hypothetical protein PK179_05745 [Spirochaetales bacterium]|nr:hypothetical protein [Spirochaetales bacterium]
MIHAALSSSAMIGADIATVLETASMAGVRGVEWSDDGFFDPRDPSSVRAAMMATLRAGLCTVSYATLYRAVAHDRSAFRSALGVARDFNAPMLRLWSGPRGYGRGLAARAFLDESRYLGDEAGKHGITLCFGISRRSVLASYDEATRVLAGTDHPFVKLAWEPASRGGFDEAMEEFRPLSGRIGLIVVRGEDLLPEGGSADALSEEWYQYLDSYDEQCGSPDMARYVVLSSTAGDQGRLAEAAGAIAAWSVMLRRYHRRRVM